MKTMVYHHLLIIIHLVARGLTQSVTTCSNPFLNRGVTNSPWTYFGGATYDSCAVQVRDYNAIHGGCLFMEWGVMGNGVGPCYCIKGHEHGHIPSRLQCPVSNIGIHTVDGNWSPWTSSWSNCYNDKLTGRCRKTLKRFCNSPPMFNGGQDCSGSEYKSDYYACICGAYFKKTESRGYVRKPTDKVTNKIAFFLHNVIWDSRMNIDVMVLSSRSADGRPHLNVALDNVDISAGSNLQVGENFTDLETEFYPDGTPWKSWYTNTFYPSLLTVDNNAMIIKAYGLMADNPDHTTIAYASTILRIYQTDEEPESFFVNHRLHKKEVTTDQGLVVSNFSQYLQRHATRSVMQHDLEAGTHSQVKHVKITYSIPALLMTPNNHLLLISSTLPSFIEHYAIDQKSQLIRQMPFIDPVTPISYIVHANVLETEWKSSAKFEQIKIFVDTTYCPNNDCGAITHVTETTNMEFYGSSWRNLNWQGAKRIMFRESGRCLSVAGDMLTTDSKCKETFLIKDNQLQHASSKRILSTSKDFETFQTMIVPPSFVENEMAFYAVAGILNNSLIFTPNFTDTACLEEINGTAYLHSNKKTIADDHQGCSSTISLLPDWDVLDSIAVKSLLQTDGFTVGAVLLTCNPSGDLGNSRNCFYTTNNGADWKALNSYLTTINYVIPQTDSLYGLCNRGKTPCKFNIATHRLQVVAQTEYDSLYADVNAILTFVLDDMDLVPTPVPSNENPEIGVSSKGLYAKNGVEWKTIFLWRQ